jgi:hypothetical protein
VQKWGRYRCTKIYIRLKMSVVKKWLVYLLSESVIVIVITGYISVIKKIQEVLPIMYEHAQGFQVFYEEIVTKYYKNLLVKCSKLNEMITDQLVMSKE